MPTSTCPYSRGRGLGSLLLPPLLPLPSPRLGGKSFGVHLIRERHDSALLGRGPERNRHSKQHNHLEPPLFLLLLLKRGVEEVFHRAGVHSVRSVLLQRCREERPPGSHVTDRDCPCRAGSCTTPRSCLRHERSRRCLLRRAEEALSQSTSINCLCLRKGNTGKVTLECRRLLFLFQTRALMCDVYVHNDMAMQRQSLRLIGGRSPGSQDPGRPRHLPPRVRHGKNSSEAKQRTTDCQIRKASGNNVKNSR